MTHNGNVNLGIIWEVQEVRDVRSRSFENRSNHQGRVAREEKRLDSEEP